MAKIIEHSEDQYFQGILQLRNPKQEVIDFLFKFVKKHAKKKVFISKEVKVKGGIDYYISSNRFLRTLGNKLQQEFGGVVTFNEQLFSYNRQTSKNVYRLNVLFRVPEFSKGDVIEINGKLVLVKGIGKKVSGKDIISGKRVSFKCPDKVLVLPKQKTTVSKVKPKIEVLHPETYESVEISNKKLPRLKLGEKINVVVLKRVYIV